jgi:hypothetical protein
MCPHSDFIGDFVVPGHSIRRSFSVYVVVAEPHENGSPLKIYVGKTGDNRSGCNSVITRFGVHVSFVRDAPLRKNHFKEELPNFDYRIFYAHFDIYDADSPARDPIDAINEMERALNQIAQEKAGEPSRYEVVNPYKGKGYCSREKRAKLAALRTPERMERLSALWEKVESYFRTRL